VIILKKSKALKIKAVSTAMMAENSPPEQKAELLSKARTLMKLAEEARYEHEQIRQ